MMLLIGLTILVNTALNNSNIYDKVIPTQVYTVIDQIN